MNPKVNSKGRKRENKAIAKSPSDILTIVPNDFAKKSHATVNSKRIGEKSLLRLLNNEEQTGALIVVYNTHLVWK